MKVVEIEEVDHSIHLQFQISLSWKENRVRYHNLKNQTSLNALSVEDINTIWLPLVIYDNTDQKEVTRLGTEWEWATDVTVTREGRFTWSDHMDLDEAEIFEGAENSLTMNQTYTLEFQCKYELQRYPFDTQVKKTISCQIHLMQTRKQECKIMMSVGSLSMNTVSLLADKVTTIISSFISCFPLSDIDDKQVERATAFLGSER